MARLRLPDVRITAAEPGAPGRHRAPRHNGTEQGSAPGTRVTNVVEVAAVPAFCRVAGTIRPTHDSAIRFEVWLPQTGWNGKFLGIGNFGWGGALMLPSMPDGLAQGYAVASNDTGHDSAAPDGQGGRFILGHPEKLVDYAYRADHMMTVHAKAIVKAFYGRGPEHAYWIGCSLGGLEGLIEAKRYPGDYDGIVVGAPPNPLVNFDAAQLWPDWLISQHPSWKMSKAKFEMISDAVIKTCAGPAGRRQGFVEEPDKCGFEPRQLLCRGAEQPDCLMAGQVRLMELIYRGPVDPRTGRVISPGPAQGSEAELPIFADDAPFVNALDLLRFAAFGDHAWDGKTIDWARDIARANARIGPLLGVDANLKPFFERGGKLLLYIGWNDYHNPEELIRYYRSLRRNAGTKGRDAVRLFTLPGVGHCVGGAGCDAFDKLGAIDTWVTTGKPPVRLVASRVEGGRVVRTRPMCSYPRNARYDGNGDPDDAASFACAN
jgi:feruloyl esterase